MLDVDTFEKFQMVVNNASKMTSRLDVEIRTLPVRSTATARTVRRECSRKLKQSAPAALLKCGGEWP